MKTNKIINADCLEFMATLPDGCIDLILTDPPYLINYKTSYRQNKKHKFCSSIANDNNPELTAMYIRECYRILKNNTAMYMFCSPDKIDYFKQEIEKYFKLKNIIIWVKNNHTAGDLEAQFGKKYEMILYANKGQAKINGKRHTDIWRYNRVAGNEQPHQNQKPVALLSRAIESHSNIGDIVFDGFIGSGSTLVAAERLGRYWIGVELSAKYCNIARERIHRERNGRLFDPYEEEI